MSAQHTNPVGQVYRCLICGAEVSVVGAGDGDLTPRCCNQAMTALPDLHRSYYCEICGAEVMVVKTGSGELVPICCNQHMTLRAAA